MASIESTQETFRLTAADVAGLSYPIDPFLSQAKIQGLVPRHIMPGRRDMYSQNWGLSISRCFRRASPSRWATSGTTPTRSCRASTSTNINPLTGTRPWPKFGKIDSKEDAGNANFNALQASLKRRLTNGLMWQTEYMWGHSMNDGMIGGGESTAPQNSNDRRAGKADSNYDIRQTMTSNLVWMLPFGPASASCKAEGAAGRIVAAGNSAASIPRGRAAPSTFRLAAVPGSAGRQQQQPATGPRARRLHLSGEADHRQLVQHRGVLGSEEWNVGNAARNLGRGPGVNQFDISLQKTGKISENHRLAFRTEFFNILNRSAPRHAGLYRLLAQFLRPHHFADEQIYRDRNGAADPVQCCGNLSRPRESRALYPTMRGRWICAPVAILDLCSRRSHSSVDIRPVVTTDSVGDDPDDPAVWVNPGDPAGA